MTPTTNWRIVLEKMIPAITSDAIPIRVVTMNPIAARVEQPAKGADDGTHDDERYPVHAGVFAGLGVPKPGAGGAVPTGR